ncbi:amino acid adenylation domain-containing protein [Mucilaginibacter sp. CSA2-8R]|uniref:non-ribosomal peptide synthetase n=1 Tax=Mucilaginibacter sp. CSA2-8R TaxID=3141542 RepID=UPI00315CF23E
MDFQTIDYNPFSAHQLQKVVPSTEQQLEIWSSILFGGTKASLAFNESMTLRLIGLLNAEALQQAFAQVLHRHESLRLVFAPDGKQLCIFESIEFDFLHQDISHHDASAQDDFIKIHIQKDVSTPFDLVNGPLFRIALFSRSATHHEVVFTIHHIVCDGWSLGLISKELSDLYRAIINRQISVSPEPAAFSDYAIQQILAINNREHAGAEEFWLNLYKDGVPVLNLPIDYSRPQIRTFSSRRADFMVDAEVINGLRSLSKAYKCSFITVFIAAFESFLYRLTGQAEITLGLPAAGQPATGQLNLVGHCVNLLPLRAVIDEKLHFAEYLQQRTVAILDAFDHQQVTLGSLIKKLNIKRDPSRVPLVPVALNVDMGFDDGVEFGDLKHSFSTNARVAENFEIFINLADTPDGLQLEWSYNAQLFKPQTIRQMMMGFQTLVKQVSENPQLLLKQITISDPTVNRSKPDPDYIVTPYPAQPLHDLIEQTANKFRDKIAVIDNKTSITYQTLIQRANRLVHELGSLGIGLGDRVAILLDRSVETVVALLAVLKAGAAYVPLDSIFPAERLNYMLEDSGARLLITQTGLFEALSFSGQYLDIEKVDWTKNVLPPSVKISNYSLAYIIYTSGSTGKPKGVEVEHRSLVNFLYSMQQEPGISVADKLLAVTTISFDIAALELFLPLLAGAQVVLASVSAAKDSKALLSLITQHKITIMQATPATWKMMLIAGWDTAQPIKALCGGEALSKLLAMELLDKCSELWNMYGPTETTVWSAVKQVQKQDSIITIGKAINNTQIFILGENGNRVATGQAGEICISGEGVARGYHQRSELTSKKFVTNRTLSQTRIYRTGDLGKVDNSGDLICLGRVDFQVKVRGYRIEVEEIESHLLQLPFIEGAVVMAVDDRLVGYATVKNRLGDDDRLVALCKEHLKKWLPAYMVPSDIIIITSFPLTPNGKTDRNALISKNPLYSEAHNVTAEPQNSTEDMLVTLWNKLLHINTIGLHDDFFEKGGHSLLAAQMVAEVEKTTGTHVPLAMLFKYPTIKGLALYLTKNKAEEVQGSLVTIKSTGSKPPVFIVHGYGLNVHMFNFLAQAMDDEQPVYALQAKGLNGLDEPADDLAKLAEYYVSEIIKVWPAGPLALGGYSLGGSIALELAKQLQAAGRTITLLAMIDAYAEVTFLQEDRYKAVVSKLLRQLGKLKFVAQSLLQDPLKTIRYQTTIIKSHFHRWLGFGEHEHTVHSPLIDEIYIKLDKALQNYKLTPYNGRVAVFKAKTRAYYVPDSKYLGWKSFAKQGIKVYEIPGDHQTMLTGNNALLLAQGLQAALDNEIN